MTTKTQTAGDMPPSRLLYKEPTPLTHEDVLHIVRGGSSEDIAHALVAVALLDDDFDFALSTVLRCAASEDAGVRGTAILCLGHLARIHRRLPEDPVNNLVQLALDDDNMYVRGQAENAAGDIEMFIPGKEWKFRRQGTEH